MSMLSVPLTPELEKMMEKLLQDGVAANKADLARKAIEKMAEEHAVQVVLQAQKEPTLRGDLDELAKKL